LALISSGNTVKSGSERFNSKGSPTVINCTFSGNSGYDGGGIHNYEDSSPMPTNCILGGDGPDEIFDDASGLSSVNYSDVEGGWTGADGNNIDDDPLLVDAANRDLHLSAASPCIDAADSTSSPNAKIWKDLDERIRYVDISVMPNTCSGPYEFVDMGA